MALSRDQIDDAIRYNRAKNYPDELVREVQKLVGVTADGKLGPNTVRAIARFQADEGLSADGKLGPATLEAMAEVWHGQDREDPDEDEDDDDDDEDVGKPGAERVEDSTDPRAYGFVELVDLRDAERTKSRGKPKRQRKWSVINGITLHQTAAIFSSPRHRGVINVPAHAMTFARGEVALLNPPTAYMRHAHKLNRRTIGIEISCNAAGVEGVDVTFRRPAWRPDLEPVETTDEQLDATRKLVRYYMAVVAARGGQIEYIYAHRQSAAKPADPGSRIWKAVGLWAQEELGLENGPRAHYTIGQGLPIPTAWDPRVEAVPYNWKYRGY